MRDATPERLRRSIASELELLRHHVWKRAGGRCECRRLHVCEVEAQHPGNRCHTRFSILNDYGIYPVEESMPSSVANAILLCRACARAHGWPVEREHVNVW